MIRIGNNEFFRTAKDAKRAATQRQYPNGATIIDTEAGFCLLNLGEGADNKSYSIIHNGQQVAELHNGKWVSEAKL